MCWQASSKIFWGDDEAISFTHLPAPAAMGVEMLAKADVRPARRRGLAEDARAFAGSAALRCGGGGGGRAAPRAHSPSDTPKKPRARDAVRCAAATPTPAQTTPPDPQPIIYSPLPLFPPSPRTVRPRAALIATPKRPSPNNWPKTDDPSQPRSNHACVAALSASQKNARAEVVAKAFPKTAPPALADDFMGRAAAAFAARGLSRCVRRRREAPAPLRALPPHTRPHPTQYRGREGWARHMHPPRAPRRAAVAASRPRLTPTRANPALVERTPPPLPLPLQGHDHRADGHVPRRGVRRHA